MVTMTVSCHNQQQTFIVFVLLCRHTFVLFMLCTSTVNYTNTYQTHNTLRLTNAGYINAENKVLVLDRLI